MPIPQKRAHDPKHMSMLRELNCNRGIRNGHFAAAQIPRLRQPVPQMSGFSLSVSVVVPARTLFALFELPLYLLALSDCSMLVQALTPLRPVAWKADRGGFGVN